MTGEAMVSKRTAAGCEPGGQQSGIGRILSKSLTSFSRRSSSGSACSSAMAVEDARAEGEEEEAEASMDESQDESVNSSVCSWSLSPQELDGQDRDCKAATGMQQLPVLLAGKAQLGDADAVPMPRGQAPNSAMKGNRRVAAWACVDEDAMC